MKFYEMEDGKYYTAIMTNGNPVCDLRFHPKREMKYKKEKGLLYDAETNRCSELKMDFVDKLDFQEIIDYVSFEKAIEHMKSGNSAKFINTIYSLYSLDDDTLIEESPIDVWSTAIFSLKMLEPKWILL